MRYQNKNKLNDYIYIPEFRSNGSSNRQSSLKEHPKNDEYRKQFLEIYEHASQLYDIMVFDNVAYECAREVLPVCTLSKIYMNGSIRSWIHYLQTRTNKHTQKEHSYIAYQILEIFQCRLPIIYNAIF